MTTQKWFVAAAIFGAAFFYQFHAIEGLKEEAAVLEGRIKDVNNLWSGSNVGFYFKSFFDGLTLGAFADDGIFTESNKFEKKIGSLRDAAASLKSRYQTATLYRNISVLGAIMCLIIAIIIGKKQAKQQS